MAPIKKIDLHSIAFSDGSVEISYGAFSRDISLAKNYLQREIPSDCTLIGLSAKLGPYLHWVLHGACTVLSTPTLAMRANQGIYEDILSIGPVDLSHGGNTLFFDSAKLAELRKTTFEDKGEGLHQFFETIKNKNATVNRIVLTSGSTGTPKAVPLTNAVLAARYEAIQQHRPFGPGDCLLTTVGRDTAAGFGSPLEFLMAGATVLNLHRGGSDPEQFAAVLRLSTRFTTVPSILAAVLKRIREPVMGAQARTVMVAGSRPDPGLCKQSEGALCSELVSFYGSTEAGLVSEISGSKLSSEPGNTGVLYPEVTVDFDTEIVSDAHGQTHKGIKIKTPWMAPGYWEEGVIVPFEDGWFRPGDVGSLNDRNELIIAGRSDDVLNYNGEKFDAVGTETRLKSLDDVDDAFVTVISSNNRDWLVVMAVSQLEQKALKAKLGTVITRVPFSLLKIQEIPRNHMGKLERARLTEYCEQFMTSQEAKVR